MKILNTTNNTNTALCIKESHENNQHFTYGKEYKYYKEGRSYVIVKTDEGTLNDIITSNMFKKLFTINNGEK